MFTINDFNERAKPVRDQESPVVKVTAAEYDDLLEYAKGRGPKVEKRLREEKRLGRFALDVGPRDKSQDETQDDF